jgi:hypothetical protein
MSVPVSEFADRLAAAERKVSALKEVGRIEPFLIRAAVDCDDCSSWWEIVAVYEVLSPADRVDYEVEGVPFVEAVIEDFDGHILEWDDERYRGPVVRFGEALAARLTVHFYCPPVGEPALEWWGGTWLDRR